MKNISQSYSIFKFISLCGIFFFTSLMAKEEVTLSIIKPDAVEKNHIGEIISRFEKAGLKVSAIKMVKLSKSQAEEFYAVHKNRPFYNDLVQFMQSGPVVVMALKGPDAISKNRELMGATDPKKALDNTIRKDFAESVQKNAVHGSDSESSAKNEVAFFFNETELVN